MFETKCAALITVLSSKVFEIKKAYFILLKHRFLTGDPWTPKGSVGRVYGVREDQKSKGLYPFTPLLQELRGPPVVRQSTLGVHETYFNF